MKQDNLPIVFSLMTILLFIIVIIFISVFLVRNKIDLSQGKQSNYLQLGEKRIYNQSFISYHDNLNIIYLNLKNPGLTNKGEYRVSLLSDKNEILAEQIFAGFNIGDPGQFRFQFAPISNSKGGIYTIQITAPDTTLPGEIDIATYEGTVQNFRNLTIDGKTTNEVLTFSTFYRNNNKINTLIDLFHGITEQFIKDLLFTISWLLILSGLSVIGYKISKSRPSPPIGV